MHLLGARYTADELADIYALWRYVGHLSGVSQALLPVHEADQRRIQELYQLTRPPVDDRSRALVAGLVTDYLIPEVAELLPARMPAARSVATTYVNGMIRAVVGDRLADELGIDESRFKHVVPALGHLTAAAYGAPAARAGWPVSSGRARPALPLRAGAAAAREVRDGPRPRRRLRDGPRIARRRRDC